jgi:chromosome partitioning protein
MNAMTAADTVLVPVQCEYYALDGLGQLFKTLTMVKERLNPDLEVEGIVFTMYDSRTNLSYQVVQNVKENIEEKRYSTIIPKSVRLADAPSYGMPINVFAPNSAGDRAYRLLAQEIIDRKF